MTVNGTAVTCADITACRGMPRLASGLRAGAAGATGVALSTVMLNPTGARLIAGTCDEPQGTFGGACTASGSLSRSLMAFPKLREMVR